MNDDDLLFSFDDLQRLKRGDQPETWLEDRKEVLLARCHAQSAMLEKLLASSDRALGARLITSL